MVLRDLRVMEQCSCLARTARNDKPGFRELQLCSACRGDYEDPDAATDGEEEDESDDEFLARCDLVQRSRDAGEGA